VRDAGLADWCWTVGNQEFGDYVAHRGPEVGSPGRRELRPFVSCGDEWRALVWLEGRLCSSCACVLTGLPGCCAFPGQSKQLSVSDAVKTLVEHVLAAAPQHAATPTATTLQHHRSPRSGDITVCDRLPSPPGTAVSITFCESSAFSSKVLVPGTEARVSYRWCGAVPAVPSPLPASRSRAGCRRRIWRCLSGGAPARRPRRPTRRRSARSRPTCRGRRRACPRIPAGGTSPAPSPGRRRRGCLSESRVERRLAISGVI
jgi:hypothetical protein